MSGESRCSRGGESTAASGSAVESREGGEERSTKGKEGEVEGAEEMPRVVHHHNYYLLCPRKRRRTGRPAPDEASEAGEDEAGRLTPCHTSKEELEMQFRGSMRKVARIDAAAVANLLVQKLMKKDAHNSLVRSGIGAGEERHIPNLILYCESCHQCSKYARRRKEGCGSLREEKAQRKRKAKQGRRRTSKRDDEEVEEEEKIQDGKEGNTTSATTQEMTVECKVEEECSGGRKSNMVELLIRAAEELHESELEVITSPEEGERSSENEYAFRLEDES